VPQVFAERTAASRAAAIPVEGQVHAVAVGHFFQRFLSVRSIDRLIGAELLGERAPLCVGFHRHYSSAHFRSENRSTESNWTLPEHRQG